LSFLLLKCAILLLNKHDIYRVQHKITSQEN